MIAGLAVAPAAATLAEVASALNDAFSLARVSAFGLALTAPNRVRLLGVPVPHGVQLSCTDDILHPPVCLRVHGGTAVGAAAAGLLDFGALPTGWGIALQTAVNAAGSV